MADITVTVASRRTLVTRENEEGVRRTVRAAVGLNAENLRPLRKVSSPPKEGNK